MDPKQGIKAWLRWRRQRRRVRYSDEGGWGIEATGVRIKDLMGGMRPERYTGYSPHGDIRPQDQRGVMITHMHEGSYRWWSELKSRDMRSGMRDVVYRMEDVGWRMWEKFIIYSITCIRKIQIQKYNLIYLWKTNEQFVWTLCYLRSTSIPLSPTCYYCCDSYRLYLCH